METESTTTGVPQSIKLAAKWIYLSLLVGLIKATLYEMWTDQKMLSDPKSLVVGILTIITVGFLGYKVSQGKNWARIVLLVLFIIGMIAFPFIIINEFQISPLIGITSLAQVLIQLYVIYILFSGESKEWFREQKRTSNNVT